MPAYEEETRIARDVDPKPDSPDQELGAELGHRHDWACGQVDRLTRELNAMVRVRDATLAALASLKETKEHPLQLVGRTVDGRSYGSDQTVAG